MRTELEILKLMLEHQHLSENELCFWVYNLAFFYLITLKEADLMKVFIMKNKPDNGITRNGWAYYCESNQLQPNIDWINEMISKLEKEVK